jgi:outer membrane receptor protein involved in Fe transport
MIVRLNPERHFFRFRKDVKRMLQAVPIDPPGQTIIVTGTALPDAPADSAYEVDVLGQRQLADAPQHRLDAILAQIPGLQLFRRSDSTSGHPTSQGVTMRALGGNASSRALLILDGVPQADPFGGWVNWPAYDPAGLAQVRVVRGGGSVPYGSGALAGVIDMRSLAVEGVDASLEAGNRTSLRAHGYWGAKVDDGLVVLDAQAGRSDGFIPVTHATRGPIDRESPYSEASGRARWIAPLFQDVEMQAAASAFIDRRDRGVPFTSNRTRGADASLRLVGNGRWQWVALGYFQQRNLRSSFASVNQARTDASRVSLQDSVPSQGFGGGFELRPPLGHGLEVRVGADLRFVNGESRELFAYVGGDPTRRRIAGGQSGSFGPFAEASMTLGRVTLSSGVRLDRWRIFDGELVERPLAGGPATRDQHFPDRRGWEPTARAGAVVKVTEPTSLRLVAYRGWRLPTLNELFRPFRAGPDATAANPFLDPETLAGVETGVRYQRGNFDFSLTAFANRLSDAIANVTLGHGPGVFPGVGFVAGEYRQRENLDAINVKGIEASAEAHRGPWALRLGASYADAKVRADGPAASLDGLRPAQTPSFMIIGGLGWEQGTKAFSLQVRHVGPQYEDDLNQQRLPPATTVDTFMSWPIADRLQLILRGDNLFNETVVAGITSDGITERATPRTLWLGFRLRNFPG